MSTSREEFNKLATVKNMIISVKSSFDDVAAYVNENFGALESVAKVIKEKGDMLYVHVHPDYTTKACEKARLLSEKIGLQIRVLPYGQPAPV